MLDQTIKRLDPKTVNRILTMKMVHFKKLLKAVKQKHSEIEGYYKAVTRSLHVNMDLNFERGSNGALFHRQLLEKRDLIATIEVRIKAISMAMNKWQLIRDYNVGSAIYDELMHIVLLDDYTSSNIGKINYRYGNRNRLWAGSYIPRIMLLEDLKINGKLINKGSKFGVVDNTYFKVFGTEVNVKRLLDMNKVTIVAK